MTSSRIVRFALYYFDLQRGHIHFPIFGIWKAVYTLYSPGKEVRETRNG